MASKQFKKMMAKKMMSYKRPHSHFESKGKKNPPPSKENSQAWFIAKRDKKKLPPTPGRNNPKDKEYSNLSMKDFLKKYPEWKP